MIGPNDKPKIAIKKKNIQVVIDYCIENNIEFSVKNKPLADDDLEVEVNISQIQKAIVFGMFMRENRLNLAGMEAVASTLKAKKPQPKKEETIATAEEEKKIEKPDDKTLF